MAERYELKTAATKLPIGTEEARLYLKSDEGEDGNLALLLRAAVQHAEWYTGRDFRSNTWTLFTDGFPTTQRFCLRRSVVNAVSSIKYLEWTGAADELQTVPATDYYLKRTQDWSEILLRISGLTGSTASGAWPSGFEAEQVESNVEVEFTTKAGDFLEEAKVGMLQHLAALWANRGDCIAALQAAGSGRIALHRDLAAQSGADGLLDHFRITRI